MVDIYSSFYFPFFFKLKNNFELRTQLRLKVGKGREILYKDMENEKVY